MIYSVKYENRGVKDFYNGKCCLMHLSSFQKYNVNNSVVLFGPDVGVYFLESGLQDHASPMIWKYIPNMDVKEIGKALFWFSYENIHHMY